jgi:hypothetical protein
MSETLKEMSDRWAILMSATDPKTGVRMCERDAKFARDTFALGVAIEERKAAEAPGAQIAEHQRKQLAWLERAQGARDKDGKRLTEQSIHGTAHSTDFARNLDKARAILLEGKALPSAYIAETERWVADQGGNLPAEKAAALTHDTTPVAPIAQGTTSYIKGSR